MALEHMTPEQFIRALQAIASAWNSKDHNSPAVVIEARIKQVIHV